MGYDVVGQTPTGQGALDCAARLQPHLVMMDIGLEGEIDGIVAAKRILDSYGIPVVFVTAYADSATIDRAKHASPYGYLVKPFEDRELQTAVELAVYKSDADKEMRRRELMLSGTLEAVSDAIIAIDATHLITLMNRSAEELTGWTLREALTQPLHAVLSINDSDGTAIALESAAGSLASRKVTASGPRMKMQSLGMKIVVPPRVGEHVGGCVLLFHTLCDEQGNAAAG